MDGEAIKAAVREYYTVRVRTGCGCGAGPAHAGETDCCGPAPETEGGLAGSMAQCCDGADVEEIPSYGCGTPFDPAMFRPGEVVVDLGSGPGRDALLAAQAVGPGGRVIGVDMTPEMITRARSAAERAELVNVEFLPGDIEALPIASSIADVVISNCVLTLVPDKQRALAEAARVLRPGGRFVVNDIVARAPLPDSARQDLEAWSACVSGAITDAEYQRALEGAGFVEINITPNGEGAGEFPTYSARVTARKP
jgi:arsenite methyltransferase